MYSIADGAQCAKAADPDEDKHEINCMNQQDQILLFEA